MQAMLLGVTASHVVKSCSVKRVKLGSLNNVSEAVAMVDLEMLQVEG
jgi:hypothetical protein